MGESSSRVNKDRRAGFTLLEVAVSLAIVATVALAAFSLQQQSFRSYRHTNRLTHAVLLAQEKLTEAQISAPVSGQGRFETSSGEILIWEVAVIDAKQRGVRIVQVRIRVPEQNSPILETATYVAPPKSPGQS